MTGTTKMCPECTAFMRDVLEKRIRRVLEVAAGEPDRKAAIQDAQATCFHFMELLDVVSGKPTSGVFDDFGEPVTITGPLFEGHR